MTVPGVGPAVALTYRATVDVPARFQELQSGWGVVRTDAFRVSIRRDRPYRRHISLHNSCPRALPEPLSSVRPVLGSRGAMRGATKQAESSKNDTPQDVEVPQCGKGRTSTQAFRSRCNERIALLTRERDEALEQQTATSEVLRVISSSRDELEPVFQAVLANATRLCEAKFGNLFLYDGHAFRTAALYGAPPAWAEARQQDPVIRPGPDTGLGRVARTKQLVHFDDIRATPAYRAGDPIRVALAELAGARTIFAFRCSKRTS